MPWLDLVPPDPVDLLCHIYRECGRLGVDAEQLPPAEAVVLRDVRAWLSRDHAEALARVAAGLGPTPAGTRRPRVWVRAGPTRRGAVSVTWQWVPRRPPATPRAGRFERRPDLRLVGGAPTPAPSIDAAARDALGQDGPSGELLRFRMATALGGFARGRRRASRPGPVSAMLVFLMRSCYEALLRELAGYAEVEAADRFVFDFDRVPQRPFQQLRSWAIVEAQKDAWDAPGAAKVVALDAGHERPGLAAG